MLHYEAGRRVNGRYRTADTGFNLTVVAGWQQVDIFTVILLTDSTAEACTQRVAPKYFQESEAGVARPTDLNSGGTGG